jgi:hypothetical protein
VSRAAATIALVVLGATCALSGCSDDDGSEASRSPEASAPRAPSEARERPEPRLRRLTCAPAEANCSSASGRILYVERVDPDGDGDAHFVLLSRESITAPGISVIDVAKELRPSPLPGPGDRISAAGPVHRGSHGQRQIQATRLSVAGRG